MVETLGWLDVERKVYLRILREINEAHDYRKEDYKQVERTIDRMVETLPESEDHFIEILSGNAPASMGILYLQKMGVIEPRFGRLSCASIDMSGEDDLAERLIEAYKNRFDVDVDFHADVVGDGFWFLEEDEPEGILVVNALNEFIPRGSMIDGRFPLKELYVLEGGKFPAEFNFYQFLQEADEEVFIYQNPKSYCTKWNLSEVEIDIGHLIDEMKEFYGGKRNVHVYKV